MADSPHQVSETSTYDSVIFPNDAVATVMADLMQDDVAIMSPDENNSSKLHLHSNETGEILTQINIGAQEGWGAVIDFR